MIMWCLGTLPRSNGAGMMGHNNLMGYFPPTTSTSSPYHTTVVSSTNLQQAKLNNTQVSRIKRLIENW